MAYKIMNRLYQCNKEDIAELNEHFFKTSFEIIFNEENGKTILKHKENGDFLFNKKIQTIHFSKTLDYIIDYTNKLPLVNYK